MISCCGISGYETPGGTRSIFGYTWAADQNRECREGLHLVPRSLTARGRSVYEGHSPYRFAIGNVVVQLRHLQSNFFCLLNLLYYGSFNSSCRRRRHRCLSSLNYEPETLNLRYLTSEIRCSCVCRGLTSYIHNCIFTSESLLFTFLKLVARISRKVSLFSFEKEHFTFIYLFVFWLMFS